LLDVAQGEAAVSASCGVTTKRVGTQFVCSHTYILVKTISEVQGEEGILFRFWMMRINKIADFLFILATLAL
jgi:hypothetical protein